MQEFFVGQFRVDILRNQIVSEGEIIALEPKVLEVLRVLAEHPGNVVSHQTLLDRVWPDIVVAPNALQRCIGQLRKALNDDGKKQQVIVTHPKKGYSLIAEVTIREHVKPARITSDEQPRPSGTSDPVKLPALSFSTRNLLLTAFALTAVIALLLLSYSEEQRAENGLSKFVHLAPLTATDSSEFYSTFSPDGRYVAFSRAAKGSQGHFWLKDLHSNQEIQITRRAGNYGQPNWSSDGRYLAFLEHRPAGRACGTATCVNINTLYIPLALSDPQEVSVLIEGSNIPNQGLQWLDGHTLGYVTREGDTSIIRTVDSQSTTQSVLYQSDNSVIYSMSYSPYRQQLAVMQESPSLEQSLLLITPEDAGATVLPFTNPSRYNSRLRWYPIWDFTGSKLLFSAENHLYEMDLKGGLVGQVIPTFQDISRPMYHPQGQSIAMTLGKVDRDIVRLTLPQNGQNNQNSAFEELTLARSILRETQASFQPGGDKIAFFSQRTGTREVWLTSAQGERQLTHFGSDKLPEYFVWSPSGKQLAVMTEKHIYLYDMKGKFDLLTLDFLATALYQWGEDNRLLLSSVGDGNRKLGLFDIKNGRYVPVYEGQVRWAQQHGREVIFTDLTGQLARVVDGHSDAVPLTETPKVQSRFFVRGDALYLHDINDYLWQINLLTGERSPLLGHPDTSIRLTGVTQDGRDFLVSKQISVKKEIVLLSPEH